MIQVLFFASLKDRLNCDSVQLELTPGETVGSILRRFSDIDEVWREELSRGRVLAALNSEMAKMEDSVQDGDELAFFPPVTGG